MHLEHNIRYRQEGLLQRCKLSRVRECENLTVHDIGDSMQRETTPIHPFGFSDELADYARSVIRMVALPPERGGAGLSSEQGAAELSELLKALVELEDRNAH